jgi:hypothetical protein
MNNLDEYLAGTDPNNAASYLRVDGSSLSNGVILQFQAITNRAYTIEHRSVISTGAWSKLLDIPAGFNVNRLISVTNAPVGANQQAYRLSAQKVQ